MKGRVVAWVQKWLPLLIAVAGAVFAGTYKVGGWEMRLTAVEAVAAEIPEIQSRLSVVETVFKITSKQVGEIHAYLLKGRSQ